MTGPPGRPLRAGASVIDIMGGMFGVIGILAAIQQRGITGQGQRIKSALFEDVVYLMGQHMAQHAISGETVAPMPTRKAAWGIYDVFETADNDRIFIGVVSDRQWQIFCAAFGLDELGADPTLADNAGRVAQRDTLIPAIAGLFKACSKADAIEKLEENGIPFAPITRPEQLWDDPHLKATGGLLDVELPSGELARLPNLPIEMAGKRFGVRLQPPQIGQHTSAVLRELGLSANEIDALAEKNVVRIAD
jgi:crotonobetainyl-CoA:carnitine CoA-transferase CaiB-like acyl-CoA transferase